jgi:hypothetical protein
MRNHQPLTASELNAVLNPIFDRHGVAVAMRRAIHKMFTWEPRTDSDRRAFDRINASPKLSRCLKDCRLETGRVFLNNLFRACQ